MRYSNSCDNDIIKLLHKSASSAVLKLDPRLAGNPSEWWHWHPTHVGGAQRLS